MSPRLHRRRRPSWRAAWFRDGLFIGFLAGVVAYGLFVHVVARVLQ